ncbi:MAG: hypothetical protein NXI22_06620 [bacterium]|nr:hypothetical protein [bacterium]
MGVQYLSVTLQVWRYSGGPPQPDEFLNQLVVGRDDTIKKQKKPSPRVNVTSIEIGEFTETEEPTEAFVAELENRLVAAAHWLDRQPDTLFRSLRDSGYFTILLFTGWIDCDQLDLDLPPALLSACGRLGLKVSIITND